VIDFDDLVGTGVLPDGYAGVNWHDDWAYIGESVNYPAHSGTQEIYSSHYRAATRFDVEPIVFEGAWFSGPGVTAVNFQLYLDHVLVATSASLTPNDDAPAFLSSGYGGLVDRIVVRETQHNGLNGYYAIDDVTFDGTPVAAPEPATLALFGAAAVGVVARRRARSKAIH
jgi:hypothetical protein